MLEIVSGFCLIVSWVLFCFFFFLSVKKPILFLFPPAVPIANSFGSSVCLTTKYCCGNVITSLLLHFSYGEISKFLFLK